MRAGERVEIKLGRVRVLLRSIVWRGRWGWFKRAWIARFADRSGAYAILSLDVKRTDAKTDGPYRTEP